LSSCSAARDLFFTIRQENAARSKNVGLGLSSGHGFSRAKRKCLSLPFRSRGLLAQAFVNSKHDSSAMHHSVRKGGASAPPKENAVDPLPLARLLRKPSSSSSTMPPFATSPHRRTPPATNLALTAPTSPLPAAYPIAYTFLP
jgi:hypothetical protein